MSKPFAPAAVHAVACHCCCRCLLPPIGLPVKEANG